MAYSIQSKDTVLTYEAVITRSIRKLKDLMVPDSIIECDTEEIIFKHRDKRSIKDQTTNMEKNELILEKVRCKGAEGYKYFKELLSMTQQGEIAELLTRTENGLDTKEIERYLYKMAEHRLSLSPNYFQRKSDLKDVLNELYRCKHGNVQLSPLLEENDTPLASFYTRPEINEQTPGNDEIQEITSLSDMFKSDDKDETEIYLTADAGLGKTTFSKYLATLWCHAHFPEEKESTSFEKEDTDFMNKYEFVFLVLLRESSSLCSIDDLIFELIISSFPHSEKFDKEFLQEILNREKCLIILDGLDEWTHPENSGKPCHRTPKSIPHRNDHKTCTVLTTTRPWKLGDLNLSSDDLGKEIALTNLTNDSAVTLSIRTIQKLKSLPDEESSKNDATVFVEEVNTTNNTDFAFVPLPLIYMICLWCDGVKIAKSKCDFYVNIVEHLLSRTIVKQGEYQTSCEPFDVDIPDCFTEYGHCTKCFTLLVNLGKLAFNTLFNDKKENTLVFNRKCAAIYLTEEDMTFSLHSGILRESKPSNRTLTHISYISFSHKTVQEFFAAIFICSKRDAQKTFVEKCKNVHGILDMSMICEFLSKMNPNMMYEISDDFMSLINEDEKTHAYRIGTSIVYSISTDPMYRIQKMLVSCLDESENIKLCLQDFFIYNKEAIQDENLQRLSKLNQTNIKSLYIDIEYAQDSLHELVELFSLTGLNHLHKLYYCGNSRKEADFSMLLFESLQVISLSCGIWTTYEGNVRKRLDTLKNVQHLDLRHLTFSHEIFKIINNFITGNQTTKALTLSALSCEEHGRSGCKMNLNLSTNSQLQNVDLRFINLDQRSILLSNDMLHIERVKLMWTEISAISLQNMVTALEDIPHSITVEICGKRPEAHTEDERVRSDIRGSHTFDVTRDDDRWFVFQTRKPSNDEFQSGQPS